MSELTPQESANELMTKLVATVSKYQDVIAFSIVAQLLYDMAQFHGRSMEDIAKLMVAVHHSRLQMAADEAKLVSVP